MKSRLLILQLILGIFLLSSCSLPTEPDPSTIPGEGDTIIPLTTEVISPEEAAAAIESIDAEGVMTLAEDSELAGRLDIGDVVVNQGTPAAPDGFLRKVTAIREENGQTILETRQAALIEAIQSCSLRDSIPITLGMIDSVWVADGVTFLPGKDLSTSFNLNLDMSFDADGNEDTDLDRLVISGNASFSAAIDLQVDIDDWELQEFVFALKREMALDAEVTMGAGYATSSPALERTIAHFTTSHYIIMVGFVPITFQPAIDVKLEFSAEGSVQVTFGYSLVETTRNGSRYVDGDWEDIDEKTKEIQPLALQNVTGEVQTKLSVGTRNSIKVYGLAGPYIQGMGFVRAGVTAVASPGGLDLSAVVEAGADVALGFHMSFLSHTFFDFSTEWEIYRLVIWENDWHFGYTGTIVVEALPGQLDAPWTLDGPGGLVEGTGSHVFEEMPIGLYSFQWEPVNDWILPDPAFQDFDLEQDETFTISGTYIEDGPGSIIGEIRDAVTNELIPGAAVRYEDFGGQLIGETAADGSGNYAFLEVQAGTYRVIAEAEGYEANTAANLQIVDVEGDLARADFALPPLTATQRFGSFSGQVRDEYGYPLSGASVSLSGGDQTNGVFRSTTSDADGTYAITGIVLDDNQGDPIAEFTVLVSAPGYQNLSAGIELVQNETITNVDFQLEPWDPDAILFSDGCETGDGWTMNGFWNRNAMVGIVNTAFPTYVLLAPDDDSQGYLPAPAEGQYAFWYGDPDNGNFLGTQASGDAPLSGGTGTQSNAGTLQSPAFTLPTGAEGATLTYDTWFEIESVNPNASGYDIMRVSVYDLTTGQTVELGRLNPTVDPTLPDRRAIPFTSGGFNAAPVWRQAEADLSQFAGHTVRLVFRFSTEDQLYNGFRGWAVDNLRVTQGVPSWKSHQALGLNEGGQAQPRQR